VNFVQLIVNNVTIIMIFIRYLVMYE
jgi:hypothetical protein